MLVLVLGLLPSSRGVVVCVRATRARGPKGVTGAALSVRIPQPRCPHCHDEVAAGAAQVACCACRAWHHLECADAHGRCSACARPFVRPALGRVRVRARGEPPPGARAGTRCAAAAVVALVAFGYARLVRPAFLEGFANVGIELPWHTELALQREGPLLVALVVMLLLHAGSLAASPRRLRLDAAAALLVLGGTFATIVALFLPLLGLFERL